MGHEQLLSLLACSLARLLPHLWLYNPAAASFGGPENTGLEVDQIDRLGVNCGTYSTGS